MKKIIIHLKHCYIDDPDSIWSVSYDGVEYELNFKHEGFDAGKVITISAGGHHIDNVEFLAWLSVFFGEDCIEPFQKEDTRQSFNRGKFEAEQNQLQSFLDAASHNERNPKNDWEKALFKETVRYYLVGLRNGLSMMPLTIGFFGLSMECVGNLVSDQNGKYHMLGSFAFKRLIKHRFEPYKRDPQNEHRDGFKAWEKIIVADSELVHAIRNAVYGHSFLHIPKERKALVGHLHKWLGRAGAPEEDQKFWFREDRLELDLQTRAAGLYKVGLRSSRLLIFLYLGIVEFIPFAEYDYKPFGEPVRNRTMKFNDMQVTISSSVSKVSKNER